MSESEIMAEFDEALAAVALIPGLTIIGHSDQPYSPRNEGEWWINVDFEHSAVGFEAMEQVVSAIQAPPPWLSEMDDVSLFVWVDAGLRFTIDGEAGSSPGVLATNVIATLDNWEKGY